ncbi:MAG: AGE family epimerase/isomerase [Chitinophagales bacterium]|nr:AGE family epimerase/isomerase [Chitinophagales bacterium]
MTGQELENELHAVLGWWRDNMPDKQQGGFYGRIDGYGQLHEQAAKGLVLNARILWTFSAAARDPRFERKKSGYGDTALRAYEYLCAHFYDAGFGGFYWSLDAAGKPENDKKQVYAQAFAIYGLSEYYLLSGNAAALDLALQTFDLLEKNTLDLALNGYFEAYSRNWVLLEDLRLSEKDANEAKTQNTHLHVLEAYANLLRAAPENRRVAAALENLIELFEQRFIDPQSAHIHLFFDEKWQLKSDIVSFGHDIEASWLLWDAAQTLGKTEVQERLKPLCLKIADATLREALDPDGAVLNERRNSDGRLDTDRIWWVQAEAILGFLNAWQMSGTALYHEAAARCWQYTQAHLRDSGGGEWYWRVGRQGEHFPEEDKAGFWKCPYHNGRMLLFGSRTNVIHTPTG